MKQFDTYVSVQQLKSLSMDYYFFLFLVYFPSKLFNNDLKHKQKPRMILFSTPAQCFVLGV